MKKVFDSLRRNKLYVVLSVFIVLVNIMALAEYAHKQDMIRKELAAQEDGWPATTSSPAVQAPPKTFI